MIKTDFSKIYGLIIGIDKYKNPRHTNLGGCVNDATSMLEYFTKNLEVPSDHFRWLFDEEATRENIVSAFCSHLIDNPAIRPYDPIVVYFAGHGALCFPSAGWEPELVKHINENNQNIEVLVTHDADTFDTNDKYIFGIPDRQLGALVYHLSKAKGNNITIILDSCHSGSGTRNDNVLVRSSQFRDAPPMPRDIYEGKTRESFPGPTELHELNILDKSSRKLFTPCLETHVLLAACRNDEKAQELEKRGVFTSALLQSLRACDPLATGYSQLMRIVSENTSRRKLPAPKDGKPKREAQTPQCEGRNQDRLLFSTQPSASKGKIVLMRTDDNEIFQIEAGNAVGIVKGTEFGFFSEIMGSASAPLALLVATDVGPTGALLKLEKGPGLPNELPTDAYVTVIKYNNHSNTVRILVNEKSSLPAHWQEVFRSLESYPITWTKPGEPSDLVLVPTEHGVELQRNTHSLEKPGPAHILLKRDLGADRLSNILSGIVRFHFHLQLQNPDAPLQKQVRMKLQELQQASSKWGIPQYAPTGADLFEECWGNGTVKSVDADPKKLFGLTVTNESEHDLFPYVLYYNFEDYSITCLYEPASRLMRAPLPQIRTEGDPGTIYYKRVPGLLSIGYGTGGSDAFNVELTNEESKKEYGVFALLLFDEWAGVAHLLQDPPLESQDKGVRSVPDRTIPGANVWDKMTVRVSIDP